MREQFFDVLALKEFVAKECSVPADKVIPRHPPEATGAHVSLLLFPFREEEVKKRIEECVKATGYFEVIQREGNYLNMRFSSTAFVNMIKKLNQEWQDRDWGIEQREGAVIVEFCSPNANKPLHLGHLRNICIGESLSRLLSLRYEKVIRTNLLNDRGIHICKAMYIWDKKGRPVGGKGDKIAGDCYVEFENLSRENPELLRDAYEMLGKWENGDKYVLQLWKEFVSMVERGFEETFSLLGVSFDRIDRESNTFLYGKEKVIEGYSRGLFKKDEKGGIYAELSTGKKYLLRADTTAIYITQDIGTAFIRAQEIPELRRVLYVVATEQNHHFRSLFEVLNILGFPENIQLEHISYGLVLLPEGKMKSREGKVVDADDLLLEIRERIREISEKSEQFKALDADIKEETILQLTRGSLAYYLLNVARHKDVVYDVDASISLEGNSGVFIQYTGARIRSLLQKGGIINPAEDLGDINPPPVYGTHEEKVLTELMWMRYNIAKAINELEPAVICNYLYDLADKYNSFYQNVPVLREKDENARKFRLAMSSAVLSALVKAGHFALLEIPKAM